MNPTGQDRAAAGAQARQRATQRSSSGSAGGAAPRFRNGQRGTRIANVGHILVRVMPTRVPRSLRTDEVPRIRVEIHQVVRVVLTRAEARDLRTALLAATGVEWFR